MHPDFIVVAAPRSGTTSLYQYLRQHPQIQMSSRKEPAFFHFAPEVPEPDFRRMAAHFGNTLLAESEKNYSQARRLSIANPTAYERLWTPNPADSMRGEATPTYLFDPAAMDAIRQALPNVRLVVLLRNPVTRAFSEYLQRRRKGLEALSFDEAVGLDPTDIKEFWWGARRYLRTGLYSSHVERAVQTFDRHSIHCVTYEDFVADSPSALREICSFLGVDPDFSFDTSHTYKTAFLPQRSISVRLALSGWARQVAKQFIPASARTALWGRIMSRRATIPPKLDERSRAWLIEFFASDILRLEQALGRNLPQWRLP